MVREEANYTDNISFNQKEIKALARKTVLDDNNWCRLFLVWFMYNLPLAIGIWVSLMMEQYFPLAVEGYYIMRRMGVFCLMVAFVMIPFAAAVSSYYLENLRGIKPKYSLVKAIAKDYYGAYIITIIFLLFATVMWTLLFIIPGIVKAIAYSMTPYLLHDNPGLELDAVTVSRRITRGHRFDMFCLFMSFVPWILISIVTLGALSVYVIPYVKTSYAIYYERLRDEAVLTGRASAEVLGLLSSVGTYTTH